MQGPDPNNPYPLKEYDKLVFLKHFVKADNIFVGDYTASTSKASKKTELKAR